MGCQTGNLPRAAVLFDSSYGNTKKLLNPEIEELLVTRTGIELLSFYKYPLMQYVLTIILSLVWISLKGIFISVWYKVWYSSYKKCGTAPACKNK